MPRLSAPESPSSAIAARRSLKSSASSRHGSVTGWLTPGQLAATPPADRPLRLHSSDSPARNPGRRQRHQTAVRRDEARECVNPALDGLRQQRPVALAQGGGLRIIPASQGQRPDSGASKFSPRLACRQVPPWQRDDRQPAKMFAFAIVDPQALPGPTCAPFSPIPIPSRVNVRPRRQAASGAPPGMPRRGR